MAHATLAVSHAHAIASSSFQPQEGACIGLVISSFELLNLLDWQAGCTPFVCIHISSRCPWAR